MANSFLKNASQGIGNALGWLAKNRVELENNDMAMMRQASMAMFNADLQSEKAKELSNWNWEQEKLRNPEKIAMKIDETTKLAEAAQKTQANLLSTDAQKAIDDYALRRLREEGGVKNELAVAQAKLLSPIEIEKQKQISQNSAEIQLQKQKDFAKYTLEQLPATERAKAKAELEAEQAKIQAQAEATWPSVAKRLGVDSSNETEKKLYISEAIADYNVKKLYPNTELTGANLIQIQKEAQDAYEKTKTAFDSINGEGKYDRLHPNAVEELTNSMVENMSSKLKGRIGGTYAENRPMSDVKKQQLIQKVLSESVEDRKKMLKDPNIPQEVKDAILESLPKPPSGSNETLAERAGATVGSTVRNISQTPEKLMEWQKQIEASNQAMDLQASNAAKRFTRSYLNQ